VPSPAASTTVRLDRAVIPNPCCSGEGYAALIKRFHRAWKPPFAHRLARICRIQADGEFPVTVCCVIRVAAGGPKTSHGKDPDRPAASLETENTGGLLSGFWPKRMLWTAARSGGSVRGVRPRSGRSSWPSTPINRRSASAANRPRRPILPGRPAADPVGRQGKPERGPAAGIRHRYAQRRSRPAVFPRHRAGTGSGIRDRHDCQTTGRRPAMAVSRARAGRNSFHGAAGGNRPAPVATTEHSRLRRRIRPLLPPCPPWLPRRRNSGQVRCGSRRVRAASRDGRVRGAENLKPAGSHSGSHAGDRTGRSARGREIDGGPARCRGHKTDRTREVRETEKSEKPAKAITAAPMPEIVASAPPAGDAEPDTAKVAPPQLSVQRTEFGVDVGGANSVGGLRALWRGLLKSRSNAALTTLRPIIVIREGSNGLRMQLRLVAGPLDDAAAAAKICAGLIENERPCETAVFDGQRLAMNADEAAATAKPAIAKPAPARSSTRRRGYTRRAAVEEPAKKPDPPPSTLSTFFRR